MTFPLTRTHQSLGHDLSDNFSDLDSPFSLYILTYMNERANEEVVKCSNCNAILPLDEALQHQDGRLIVICPSCGSEETILTSITTAPLITPDPE